MKRKMLAMVFATVMVCTTAVSASSELRTIEIQDNNLSVSINNVEISGDSFYHDDTLYVPLAKVAETLGAAYIVDYKNNTIQVNTTQPTSDSLTNRFLATSYNYIDNMWLDMLSDFIPNFNALGYLMYNVFTLSLCGNFDLAIPLYEQCLKQFDDDYASFLSMADGLLEDCTEGAEFGYNVILYSTNKTIYTAQNTLSKLAAFINNAKVSLESSASYDAMESFMSQYTTYNSEWSTLRNTVLYLNVAYTYGASAPSDDDIYNYELIKDKFEEHIGTKWCKKYEKEKDKYTSYFFDASKITKVNGISYVSPHKHKAISNVKENVLEKEELSSIVYWESDAIIYHKSESCKHLNEAPEILSGSIEQSRRTICCDICG